MNVGKTISMYVVQCSSMPFLLYQEKRTISLEVVVSAAARIDYLPNSRTTDYFSTRVYIKD